MQLTYRERFARTLAHEAVDRVPMDLDSTDMTGIDGGPRRLARALGVKTAATDAQTDEAVLRALDTDIRGVGGVLAPQSELAKRISDTEVINEWGIKSRWNGDHYEMVSHPLANATLADLEKFPWPSPDSIDPGRIREIAQRARQLFDQTPYVVCGRHPVFGVMELGCWMCGYDDFLLRMAADPEFVRRFFEIVSQYQWRVDEIYYSEIGRYIHFTTSGDDFGTQVGPFISPAMFREMVLPYLAKRIAHVRQFTQAAFFHHSCGAIAPLIPDLIAAGVQILNPLQPRAAGMDPASLKRQFGSQLTFYGAVDTQELLPRGTPEEVSRVTKELIEVLGAHGGYVLSAAHTLQSDVPAENVVAMYRAGLAPLG